MRAHRRRRQPGAARLVLRRQHWRTRYQSTDADALLAALNRDFAPLREALLAPCVLFVTLGTAYVYRLHETGAIVANCHKLPAWGSCASV